MSLSITTKNAMRTATSSIQSVWLLAVRTELRQASYSAAKSDMERALSQYPKSCDVVSEGVFVNLLVGNIGEADRLHELLKTTTHGNDEPTECLYYYGRNQPLVANSHCEACHPRT